MIDVWSPPAFMRHITDLLMLFAVDLHDRRLHPEPHQDQAQASDAGEREDLGAGASVGRTAISARSCCSVRSWPGACLRASPPSGAAICGATTAPPAGPMTCLSSSSALSSISRSALVFHPIVIGVPVFGSVNCSVSTKRRQAVDRARYPRAQRRRSDRRRSPRITRIPRGWSTNIATSSWSATRSAW